MKQRFGKSFILIPIGIFILSGTILIAQLSSLPDPAMGLLFGIGIGLMMLPFIIRKIKPDNC